MQQAVRKMFSYELPIFIFTGIVLGIFITMITDLPNQLFFIVLAALAFPFVIAISGNARRLFLLCLIFAIPINIDINFIHQFENQAGAYTLGVALRDILLLLLLIYWIIRSATRKSAPFRFYARTTVPALLYIEAALLSMIWAPRLDLATLELVQMGKVFLLYFVVANQIEKPSDLKFILWALLATIFFESALASLQLATGSSLSLGFLGEMQMDPEGDLERVGGTLGHPNRLARYLELLLPFCLGVFLIVKKRLFKFAALAVFASGFAAMIMTGSRGGWIATLAAVMLFFYLALRHRHIQSRQLIRLVFLSLVAISLIGMLFFEQIENRITGEDHGSAMSRIPMFQIALSIIEAHPVGGVGINNYAVIMREYNDTILGRRFSTIPRPVHNMYLLIAGETGMIGLIAFLLLVFALISVILRGVKSTDPLFSLTGISLLCGLTAFLIHGLVDKHPPGGYPLFYLLMALAAANRYFAVHGDAEKRLVDD